MRTPFEEVFRMYTTLSVTIREVVNETVGVDVYNKVVRPVGEGVGTVVHNDVEDVIDE